MLLCCLVSLVVGGGCGLGGTVRRGRGAVRLVRGTVRLGRGSVRINRGGILRGCSISVVLASLASSEQQRRQDSGFQECNFAKKKSIDNRAACDGGNRNGRQVDRLGFSDRGGASHHQHTSNNHGPLHCCWREVDLLVGKCVMEAVLGWRESQW